MKISQLIRSLERAKEEFGDVAVTMPADMASDYDDRDECDNIDLLPIGERGAITRILIADGAIVDAVDLSEPI